MSYKFNLSIISMFKNEGTIIESWIKHYLDEGVEHFYLIDNGSTDNYESIIKPYINKITLVKDSTRIPAVNGVGTQQLLQNKYFLAKVKKESKWVFICDIDEYLYNSKNLYIMNEFNNLDKNYDYIQIPFIFFGSNLDKTPNNIPIELIYREKFSNKNFWKTIIKTNHLVKIDCHNHISLNNTRKIKLNFNDNLKLNHYQIISKEYYKNIRCIRGGGVHGCVGTYKYNKKYFDELNTNFIQVLDKTLKIKKELKDWWKIYNLNYNLNIKNYQDSYVHWCNNKNLNKTYKFSINNFNWQKYINNYKDLKKRLNYNKESAWKHYLNYGIKEKRKYI